MTSFSNSFYDSEFPRIDASKKTIFYGKICIKESLEIEKTQVVCCGHPQNNYFMLNSNKISHCASTAVSVVMRLDVFSISERRGKKIH